MEDPTRPAPRQLSRREELQTGMALCHGGAASDAQSSSCPHAASALLARAQSASAHRTARRVVSLADNIGEKSR